MIKLGIVGGGGVGRESLGHVATIAGAQAVAVAEPDEAARGRITELFKVPCYSSVEEMLRQTKLDAVKICTPNDLHAKHTIACLDAGLHVLCEKPLATSLADGAAMLQAARRSRRILMVNFEYRHSLLFARIKQLIDAGTIGRVVNIHFSESRGAFHGKAGGWRFDQERSGGIFIEKLCHYVDLAAWFSGAAVQRVHAFAGQNTLPHYRVADNVHALFEMDQNVTFSLTANHGVACDHPQVGRPVPPPLEQWSRLGHEAGFKIAGDRGSIISDDWRLTLCVNKLVEDESRGGWRLAHDHIEDFSSFRQHACIHDQAGMLAYFLQACMTGEARIEPNPEQLLNVLAASLAAEKAIAQRIPVTVDRCDAEKPSR